MELNISGVMKGYLIFFVLVLTIPGYSQSGRAGISGTVSDSATGQPVVNAGVLLYPVNKSVTTDEKGSFLFDNLDDGEYKVVVKHLSYKTLKVNVILKGSDIENLVLNLIPDIKNLNEVVISEDEERRILISKMPYIQTSFVKTQIARESTGDAGDFLRSSNNISGIRKGGANIDPVVRGFKFSQLNIVVNDGQRITGGCPNRMDPALSHLDINDIEKIVVMKGPFDFRYGPVSGGTINLITTNQKYYDKFTVDIEAVSGLQSNWEGMKQNLSVSGGSKRFFFNLKGNYKRYGDYKDGNGKNVNAAYTKYNYGGYAGFMPAENHTILLNYEESYGRNVDFPALPMDERKDDTKLISLDYGGHFDKGSLNSIKFKIYSSGVEHQMDNKSRAVSDTVIAVSDISANNSGANLTGEFNIKSGTLYTGFDFKHITKDGIRVKSMILQPHLPVKKEKLWNNAVIDNGGAFVYYSVKYGNWDIFGSSRIDFNFAKSDSIVVLHPVSGEIYKYSTDSISSRYVNFSISAGATKHFTEKASLSISFGRGVRSPDMVERFIILLPVGYDKFDYLGNPQLKPETNNEVDLTLKYESERWGLLQVNGFYSLINDYITGERLPPSVQKPLTKGVLGVKKFVNAGMARIRGFEFVYASPGNCSPAIDLRAGFTYGTIDRTLRYVTNESGQVTGDEELINDAMPEIPPFESTVTVKYSLFDGRLVPALAVRMTAAQNHISLSQYENPSPGFVTVKFNFRYIFNENLTITGGINNIFDRAYYEHLNRNIIGENFDLYEPGRSFWLTLYFKINSK